jgi:Uma2 family endonuclease
MDREHRRRPGGPHVFARWANRAYHVDRMQGLVFESTQTLTPQEFADFVEERVRLGDGSHYELLNGRVVMNPPAGYPHGEVGSNVQWILGTIVRERKLGKVFDSSQGFELPSGDTVEPDHSFVSSARWSAAPLPEVGKFLRVVPDLVVEVLSTRTASQDRGEKKHIYERNGVLEYWLVDARAREVTVFTLRDGRFGRGRTHGEEESYVSDVLAGASIAVRDLLPGPIEER